ncbi:competence protein ComEC [Parapedobacter composti]|uniref:Competence protein ComEC n=1 Tax=Parapedobacter composti TaxID=623281 RepID=A0A1I1HGC3_9SPHI|nr:competence protein ComEC [Parapedobacter composti]
MLPNPIHRGHVPFARLLFALLVGISLGYAAEPNRTVYLTVCGLLAAVVLIFMGMLWYTRLRKYQHYGVLGLLVLVSLAAAGLIRTWQPHPGIDRKHFSHYPAAALVGYVGDEPTVRGETIRFPLMVTHVYGDSGMAAVRGTLMLTIHRADTLPIAFTYGDELIVPATYRQVPPPYNPGEIDYRSFLANRNCWHQAYIPLHEVQKIGKDKGLALRAYALSVRQQMVAKFSRYIRDRDALSIASTLILGYRAELREELLQAFSNTGTIHVLSVSGMHVIIVYWLFSRLFWWMDRGTALRVAKLMVLLLAVWGYALLTGFSPSVLRAATMASFVIAGATFRRQSRIYNSIAASAFFLLLYHPKFIAYIGFQLSYLAVLGIVFLYAFFRQAVPSGNRFTKPVLAYASVSTAAQAGAGPLAAYHFHHFPLYFLPANLLVVLPVSAIMYLGFVLLAIPYVPFASVIAVVLEQLILAVNRALHVIEGWPGSVVNGIWVPWWELPLMYGLLVAFVLAMNLRSKRWAVCAGVCMVLWTLSSFMSWFSQHDRDEMVVFNVQGDIAIGLIGQRNAWLYSNLAYPDDRKVNYSVRPKLTAHVPEKAVRFIPYGSSYGDGRVYVSGPVIQFGGRCMMIYDGRESFTGHLAVDILLFRNNPSIALESLTKMVSCRRLVLDGSNNDVTIARLKAEAEAMDIPVYVLKNNFAYVWDEEAHLP